MTDLAYRTALDLAAAIRRRELGCRELLEHYLERIERLNPAINAIVTLDPERARKQADEADAALIRGELRGPFHGLPMTVKDAFETRDMRTTSGAPLLANHVPQADAVAVARLVGAGANIIGKTNMPMFAGDAQSYNPLFGTTNNPWNTALTPGGSSGGAAAALAAGLTPLELGSDLGGSIRTPAHFCGVYGHKPTYGLIPHRGHIPGPPGSLSQPDLAVTGPMARSPQDLAAALAVLAGPDDDRAVAWKLELPPPRRSRLREYRIAAWLDDPACPTDAGVLRCFHELIEALRREGVEVDEQARPVPDLAEVHRNYLKLFWPLMVSGMPRPQLAELERMAATLPEDDRSSMAVFARTATLRHYDWLVADRWRAHYRARWAAFFRTFDVLLCPTAPVAAFPHDHSEPMGARKITVNGELRSQLDLMFWAGVVTTAYLPATVAPVGRTSAGLPVGIQIVGPYLEDRTTLDVAAGIAEITGGFQAPPGY